MATTVVAALAEYNRLTFKEAGVTVNIARFVIVVNDRAKLFDFRVATGAQPLLLDFVPDCFTSVERGAVKERLYTNLIRIFL